MKTTDQVNLEIKEIIAKNLPAQVGEVLQLRLEQADRDANTVKNLTEIKSSNETTIRLQQSQIESYKQFDDRNAALDQREKDLVQREMNLGIEVLKYQLAAEKEKTQFTQSVAMGLVRNTEYKKTIFDSENKGGFYDDKGNYIPPVNTSKSYTEDKTKS
jgi:hypothetical protein